MKEKRVTWKEKEKFIKHKLMFDNNWATKALMRIYEFQTMEEREKEMSIWENGVGFDSCDSFILSSIAEFYKKRNFITPKQMDVVHRCIPKYWRQIWDISDQDIMEKLIKESRDK